MKSRDLAFLFMTVLLGALGFLMLTPLTQGGGGGGGVGGTRILRQRRQIFDIDTKYNRQGSFHKEGLLRDHETGKLKPLLSRQISSTRHQYFTSENHDGFMLNVPLFDQQGRSCTSGAGCGSLFEGDVVRGIGGDTYSFISL